MKSAWLRVRSVFFWGLTLAHFGLFTIVLLSLQLFKRDCVFDGLIRLFFRNIQRLAGIRVRYEYAPGFDRTKTSLLVSNHVNLFDPFILYPGLPQFARGLELESHFDIPVYGWLMSRFGNIPVPDMRSASGLKRTFRLTKQAVENGTSLVVFAEGGRTLDGYVAPFEDGAFVLAQKFKTPIVPLSIVGSFEFKRKGQWLLRPAVVTVHVHDTVETDGLSRKDLPALRERIHAIVSAPVTEHMNRLYGPRDAGAPPALPPDTTEA